MGGFWNIDLCFKNLSVLLQSDKKITIYNAYINYSDKWKPSVASSTQ